VNFETSFNFSAITMFPLFSIICNFYTNSLIEIFSIKMHNHDIDISQLLIYHNILNSSNISISQGQTSQRIDSRNLTIQINYRSSTAISEKQAHCFIGIERQDGA